MMRTLAMWFKRVFHIYKMDVCYILHHLTSNHTNTLSPPRENARVGYNNNNNNNNNKTTLFGTHAVIINYTLCQSRSNHTETGHTNKLRAKGAMQPT